MIARSEGSVPGSAGLRFLDHVGHVVQPALGAVDRHHAIASHLAAREPAHREHGRPGLVMRVDELLQARVRVAEDHVIGQQDSAGLAFHQSPRRPHGMTETERLLLLKVCDVDLVAQLVHLAQDVEQVALATLRQVVLELERAVEVVDDGALAAACDHDHLLDSAGDGLLDAVLDRRLIDERQHLLRLRLGDRKKSRAKPGGWKDGFTYRGHRH
jgi:hypothetical protein